MSGTPHLHRDPSKVTEWFHKTIDTIYSATGKEEDVSKANDAFDNALTAESKVAVNHSPLDLPSFKKLLLDGRGVVRNVSIEWNGDIEVETDDHTSVIVAGRFTATQSLKFRIRVAAAQTVSDNVFSARICNAEPYKIEELYLTTLNRATPIYM